ncbi:hypothetical protein R2B67_01060 [Streptomyces cyaneofuscatus]|uniref:hypothetical protein n=1 Tax=Streptomyces cyaneofuscatus TaxID=66883 RepID=UPI002952BDD5|nr:hypothetical protein [Streptomyces cyaneofuscatus]WOP07203.1 hypothetical protein R2B67_01060 [Streptomyces cyaneofuscatus]
MSGVPDAVDDQERRAARREVLLLEYEVLKAEQKARIIARDHLMYATLAGLVSVLVVVFTAEAPAGTVLLLPPVCLVLGWTYLVNDLKISAAGRYLRDELAPRLADLTGTRPGEVLGWEWAHRGEPGRIAAKILQLAVDLVMFVVPTVVAVVLHWMEAIPGRGLSLVAAAELAAAAVLAVRIVLAADFASERRTP